MRVCPRLVVAATASGSGKTSVALGLALALRRRGMRVQTFKTGPDFLDPSYLSLASGRPCYNLDGWMCGREYLEALFARTTCDADIAIIEGVMGLFDGADPVSLAGSTAEVAAWLQAPVLLIASAGGASRSVAATIYGFVNFERSIRIGGIVLNRCGSKNHAESLAESLRAASLPPVIGALTTGSLPTLPSRHLGLVTATAESLDTKTLDRLADSVEQQVSLEKVCQLAQSAPEMPSSYAKKPSASAASVRIAIARDDAFHFYYPDSLEALQNAGAELVYFSPLRDARLPDCCAALYLGGGYPEEYAEELAANQSMLDEIRQLADRGHPIYAECGGLMYLSRGIETRDGWRHSLVSLLPAWTRMLERRKALGYVEAIPIADSLFAERGQALRGHEFHYSELTEAELETQGWSAAYRTRRRRATDSVTEGFHRRNVLASYIHVHFASHPGAAQRFVGLCRETLHGQS